MAGDRMAVRESLLRTEAVEAPARGPGCWRRDIAIDGR